MRIVSSVPHPPPRTPAIPCPTFQSRRVVLFVREMKILPSCRNAFLSQAANRKKEKKRHTHMTHAQEYTYMHSQSLTHTCVHLHARSRVHTRAKMNLMTRDEYAQVYINNIYIFIYAYIIYYLLLYRSITHLGEYTRGHTTFATHE